MYTSRNRHVPTLLLCEDHQLKGLTLCASGTIKVSPPQMPVLLKRMYNANILRAEITTFVPSCPPM